MTNPRMATALMAVLILVRSGLVSLSEGEPAKEPNGFERAVALLQEGIFLEAVHELERFVAAYPVHEESRMLLARTLYRVKREARAAEEASNVLRINPDNVDAQSLLIRIRSEFGQRLNRKDHAEVLRYARMCAVPGSYDRAADFYRLALSLDDDVPVHLEFARMLFWAGRNEESAYQYEYFLEKNPENADALAEVGRVYNASGRFTQAIAAFEAGLKIRSGDLALTLDMIRALIWSGKEKDAIGRLHVLIQKQVGGDKPLMLLASIARIQDRVLDEYGLLMKVIKVNPDNEEAHSRINELEGGAVLEIAHLLARLEQEPENLLIHRQLADIYVTESRFEDALYQLDLIAQRVPNEQDVTTRLLELREQERRIVMERISVFHRIRETERQREINSLREWLSRNTGDMKSRLRLANLYFEGGGFGDAAEQLEWLMAANPDNEEIIQTLHRVQKVVSEHKENQSRKEKQP